MKKEFIILSLFILCLSSCDRPTTGDRTTSTNTQNVDNTGRNTRDRNFNTLTAGDQSENEADRTITQKIRKLIVAEEGLSINGKNIKIITIDGVVTLRGVVDSPQEKDLIDRKSRQVSGVSRVDNQLEIRSR